MFYRKWITTGITLVLLIAVAVGSYLISTPETPDAYVRAQDHQPASTVELFKPFWEAWDLLHENYVDPLDDGDLVEGAQIGLLKATGQALFELPIPSIDKAAANPDDLFAPFWETWTSLHETFPDELDDNALMEGALSGMVDSIGDEHTAYMNPEAYIRINEGMSGEYEGIGATVEKNAESGGLELITIFEESPADQAGLRPGDQIVLVEGEDITALDQTEIIAMVRGPAGTPVLLGILRPGEGDILDIEVVRGRISIPSVVSEVLEGNIGYVRLSQFEFSTS
ncbi:MAG: PDZ domain-containing protein, partial [Chloroflexi bacterium]